MKELRRSSVREFMIGGTACGMSVFLITLFIFRDALLLRDAFLKIVFPIALVGFVFGFICSVLGVALGKYLLARKNQRTRKKQLAEQPLSPRLQAQKSPQ